MKLLAKMTIWIVLALTPARLLAQTVENNVQQRLSATLQLKPWQKTSLTVNPEFRSEGYGVSGKEYLLEGGMGYALNTWLKVGGRYRLQQRSGKNIGRMGIEATFIKTRGRFPASLRLLFTRESVFGRSDGSESMLRFRIKMKYKALPRTLRPLAGVEFFRNIRDSQWQKNRYFLGVQFRLGRKIKLISQYKLDYFLSKFQNNHIVDLGIKISL